MSYLSKITTFFLPALVVGTLFAVDPL